MSRAALQLEAAVVLVCVSSLHGGTVLHVDDDAPPGGDGLTWASSYRHLQDALAAAAVPGSGILQIRVAGGSYLPDRTEANPAGTGDRESTFSLLDGVTVRGGYAGAGSETPDENDPQRFETILSGDLTLDDGADFEGNAENALQVVTAGNVGPATVLEGCTITAGNADFIHVIDNGAGLSIVGGSPTIIRCRFMNNVAGSNGGGVYSFFGSPTVAWCTFEDNVAGFGGGMLTNGGDPVIACCSFTGNAATDGGGLFNLCNSTVVSNCSFFGNTAKLQGGGVFNREPGSPSIVNSSFFANTASSGAGLRVRSQNTTALRNCILWGDSAAEGAEISLGSSATVTVLHSNVEGGEAAVASPEGTSVIWQEGNLDADPMFQGGDDLELQDASPCIDAGHNWAVPSDTIDLDADAAVNELIPFDIAGSPRFSGDDGAPGPGCGTPVIVDMGAYEHQGVVSTDVAIGDATGDGAVDVQDLIQVIVDWGVSSGCGLSDFDLSGEIDVGDLVSVIVNWSAG